MIGSGFRKWVGLRIFQHNFILHLKTKIKKKDIKKIWQTSFISLHMVKCCLCITTFYQCNKTTYVGQDQSVVSVHLKLEKASSFRYSLSGGGQCNNDSELENFCLWLICICVHISMCMSTCKQCLVWLTSRRLCSSLNNTGSSPRSHPPPGSTYRFSKWSWVYSPAPEVYLKWGSTEGA